MHVENYKNINHCTWSLQCVSGFLYVIGHNVTDEESKEYSTSLKHPAPMIPARNIHHVTHRKYISTEMIVGRY